MSLTLRQRNRLAAMQHIQSIAMDLFDERGYQAVTVEDIAEAAGVSASTFYRYFGTKEGVFTVDTVGGLEPESLFEFVNLRNLDQTFDALEAMLSPESYRGMNYIINEPAVRMAIYRVIDAVVLQLVDLLSKEGVDPLQARMYVRSLLFGGYLGALEQWHLDGRHGSPIDAMRKATAGLRPLEFPERGA